MFNDVTLAQHTGANVATLRARADELAALCRLPLPDGDAGLIEAARRLAETSAAIMSFDLKGENGSRIESEIIEPVVSTAQDELVEILEERAPQTLRGAAIKLRHMIEWDASVDSIAQVVACLERVIAMVSGP